MKTRLFFAIILMFFLIIGVNGCKKSDISGVYKNATGIEDSNHKKIPLELMIAQNDKNLSGKVTIDKESRPISFGTMVDDNITITVSPNDTTVCEIQIDAKIKGNIIEGNFIGTWIDERGRIEGYKGPFKVTRQ